jgi:hypothetical protein
MYRSKALKRFEGVPIIEESVKFQLAQLRKELAGDDPSPLEELLVDAVLACHSDYWLFSIAYENTNAESFNLRDMEQWEKILASKEARYLQAIETLARVRRLLKLPSMQVNIAAPGGQQVNIAGELPG